MKYALFLLFVFVLSLAARSQEGERKLKFFSADNPSFQYVGRIDFSNPKLPRFWQPGVYINTIFWNETCYVILNDEVLYGNSHNYVDIVVDDKPHRYKLTGKTDTIQVFVEAQDKPSHRLLVCKDTEAGIGYLEFVGLLTEDVRTAELQPSRKIEFIGNSITCGSGMDFSSFPCGQGTWYDQHNAYMSYGPVTARALHAQWSLSAVSGIGLIHSCCNMTIVMPQVFDKVNMRENTSAWNFNKYQPDVVTVCLGQNDGIQDSTIFCGEYIKFLQSIRSHYPAAEIICLSGPMADENLGAELKNYLTAIVSYMQGKGDKKIDKYFYSKQYHHGCGGHPDMQEHQQIAAELTKAIRKIMKWKD